MIYCANKACRKSYIIMFLLIPGMICNITGCAGTQANAEENSPSKDSAVTAAAREKTVLSSESAQDASIDFPSLQKENPDIFAWIYIPGTEIDYPVLQSRQGDGFYESHDASGAENVNGAVYTELANLTTMCDFNTVLHGKTGEDNMAPFSSLYQFSDPVFFNEHENIYLYLDGNVLTYEIFAAYERENTSLLRTYDFTSVPGCQQFLHDLYNTRDLGTNLREGWDFVGPYHFLITLAVQEEDDADTQFVVVAILTQDAAGTISRVMEE